MTPPPPERPQVTDSPWFWAALFCMAALVLLVAAEGQVDQRQVRIERQAQARQRGAEIAAGQAPVTEVSTPGNTVISIQPLLFLLVAGVVVAGGMYWLWRFRARASAAQGAGPEASSEAAQPALAEMAQGRCSRRSDAAR